MKTTPKRPAKKIKAKRKVVTNVDYAPKLLSRIAADMDALREYVTNNVPTMSQVRELEKLLGYQRAVIDRLTREREELNNQVKELTGNILEITSPYGCDQIEFADDTPNPLADIERREAMRKGIDEAYK